MAARAVEFLVLTAARSGEIRGATWGEIQGDLWVIPAERMKAGATHTVTLSTAARAVLADFGPGEPNEYIFPSQTKSRPLSDMALTMLLRRMGQEAFTIHGFRSAFKDWAVDCTEFPDEISEEALAHIVGSKVRRAYRRGEALDRRRALMEAWANHLTNAPTLALIEAAAA
jgi:integrase